MLLVARLGLRSIEVARLELADVDWRGGVLTGLDQALSDSASSYLLAAILVQATGRP